MYEVERGFPQNASWSPDPRQVPRLDSVFAGSLVLVVH